MCIPKNYIVTFTSCKICYINTSNNKDSAAEFDACQLWVPAKCIKPYNIDYIYFKTRMIPDTVFLVVANIFL